MSMPPYASEQSEDEEMDYESDHQSIDELIDFDMSGALPNIRTHNTKKPGSKGASGGNRVKFSKDSKLGSAEEEDYYSHDQEEEAYNAAAKAQLQAEVPSLQKATSSVRYLTLPPPATKTCPNLPAAASNQKPQSPYPHVYPPPSAPNLSEPLTPQERKDNELDAKVMKDMAANRALTLELCTKYLSHDIKISDKKWEQWVRKESKKPGMHFIKYVRAVAEGAGGVEGWHQLVSDGPCRVGLGYGIIQRALISHVYESLCFGAPADLMEMLVKTETTQEDEDGFIRQEQRAHTIASFELTHNVNIDQCLQRKHANLKMTLQITELLRPLVELKYRDQDTLDDMTEALLEIVTTAAELAALMKRSGTSVLYAFKNVFKWMSISPIDSEVLNKTQMMEASKNKVYRTMDELVRIVCADKLVAFRKGGGVAAERWLEKNEKEVDWSVAPELRHLPRNVHRNRLITANDGYREKFLVKAVVIGFFGVRGDPRNKDLPTVLDTVNDGGCAQQ